MNFKRLSFALPVVALALAVAGERPARADSFDCTSVKLHKNPPVPFVPFPLVNPQTGEHYLPNQNITVNGKTYLASDFFGQLNSLEQTLNAWGYSLRDATTDTLQELDQCLALLNAQIGVIKQDKDKNPPNPLDLAAREKELEDKWNAYKQNLPSWDDLWANAGKSSTQVNLPTPPPFTAPVPQAAKVEPRDVFKKRTWSFQEGDLQKFGVGGNAYVSMIGNREITTLEAGAAFNAGLMGLWSGEVAGSKAYATAGKNQDPKIGLEVRLVGQTVWNPTYPDPSAPKAADGGAPGSKVTALLHKNDKFSAQVDQGVEWRFAVGPVPCKGRLGLRGEIGLAYGYDVALTAVGGFAGPYADADAYAQVGVDIGLAGAGVEGSLLLLKDELTLRGDATIDFVDEPKVQLDLSASNDIEALSGKISVYAFVDLFITKWKGNYDLWSWDGYKDHTDIFHFKYVWTPTGVRADGDVQPEDVAEVNSENYEIQVAQLKAAADQRLYAVMKAVADDLGSAQIPVVAADPTVMGSAATGVDKNIDAYLMELKKWLAT